MPEYKINDRVVLLNMDTNIHPQIGTVIGLDEPRAIYTIEIDKEDREPGDVDGLVEVPFDSEDLR